MTPNLNFEWFYYDLHSKDGFDLICTIHTKPFNSIFEIILFDIFLYKDSEVVLHHYFTLNKSDIMENPGSYLLYFNEKNHVVKNDEEFIVTLNDHDVDFNLKLFDLPKYSVSEHELLNHPNENESFIWKLFSPYCTGNAILKWDNQERSLSGIAYHDYNAGSINLKTKLNCWFWGKYYFDNKMLVYGEIIARDKSVRKISLLVSKNQIIVDDAPLKKNDENKTTITFKGNDYCFEIKSSNIVDKVSFFMARFFTDIKIWQKVVEVVYFMSMQYCFLKPIKKVLANTRYKRLKSHGLTQNGLKFYCFYEEMNF